MLSLSPRLTRLSPSRSKNDFLNHLGLDESDAFQNALYLEMMNEAAEGWQNLVNDRGNLTHEAQSCSPPYSSSQVREAALHEEVLNIYRNAGERTKKVYRFGIHPYGTNPGETDNWIIRWCLWHVFRYRDERNRAYRQRNPELVRKVTTRFPIPDIYMNLHRVPKPDPDMFFKVRKSEERMIKIESLEPLKTDDSSFSQLKISRTNSPTIS